MTRAELWEKFWSQPPVEDTEPEESITHAQVIADAVVEDLTKFEETVLEAKWGNRTVEWEEPEVCAYAEPVRMPEYDYDPDGHGMIEAYRREHLATVPNGVFMELKKCRANDRVKIAYMVLVNGYTSTQEQKMTSKYQRSVREWPRCEIANDALALRWRYEGEAELVCEHCEEVLENEQGK